MPLQHLKPQRLLTLLSITGALASSGCQSGWNMPGSQLFGWGSPPPSAETLAGSGPSLTYPISPAEEHSPQTISSLASSSASRGGAAAENGTAGGGLVTASTAAANPGPFGPAAPAATSQYYGPAAMAPPAGMPTNAGSAMTGVAAQANGYPTGPYPTGGSPAGITRSVSGQPTMTTPAAMSGSGSGGITATTAGLSGMTRPGSASTATEGGPANRAADPAFNRYAMPNAAGGTPGTSVSTQLKDTPPTGMGGGHSAQSSPAAAATVGPEAGYPYPQTLGPPAAVAGSLEDDGTAAGEPTASPYRPGSTGRSTDFSLPPSTSGSGSTAELSPAAMPPMPLPSSSTAPATSSGGFSMPPLSPSGM
jgi:hypothetical protein